MDLATLNVDPAEAEAKVREYEGLIATERSTEDEAILAGYRAARRGLPIIRLTQTIIAGGFFDSGMPRLAVINADARECYAQWTGDDLLFQDENTVSWTPNRGALVNRHTVRVPGVRPEHNRWSSGWTSVPVIPPSIRPRRNRLHRRHVLWEVDKWQKRVPPGDPALLRHIRGDLWLVEAVWDLTDLEKYVLTQRA